MTDKRLSRNEYFVKALINVKSPKQRGALLKYATRDQILTLSEIIVNFLQGNIKFTSEDQLRDFIKHKRLFRIAGFRGRKSWIKRKQAIIDLGKTFIKFLKVTYSLL